MISFPADIAAEPLLYDTTRCDDCPGVRYVFSGVGSAGGISRGEWVYPTPVRDWHVSIGCYMVQGIHIALDGIGVWKIKHGLLAGIRYIQRHRRMGQKPSQLLVYILEGSAILSGLAAAIMKSTLE